MKKLLVVLLFFSTFLSAQSKINAFVGGTGYGLPVPGGIASIYGNFINTPTMVSTSTLGTMLGGLQVLINDTPAPLYYVSNSQINLQVPWTTTGNIATVKVLDATGNFPITAVSPNIFVTDDLTRQGSITNISNQLITVLNDKVSPGNAIQIYCTGLGTVDVPQTTGTPNSKLTNTVIFPQVLIGGNPAKVLFSGLAPGFVGLYQVNAIVPNMISLHDIVLSALTGEISVQLTMNGIPGNIVFIGFKGF